MFRLVGKKRRVGMVVYVDETITSGIESISLSFRSNNMDWILLIFGIA